jgi:hypothetical protein
MEYRLSSLCDSEPVDAMEAHVLALAYEAAWRALHLTPPVGQHVIEPLDLAIEFGPRVTH